MGPVKRGLLVAVLVVCGVAAAQEVWEHAGAEAVNKELNKPGLIDRGRYLAIAGDCQACHTQPGGTPFAGGRAMEIPLLGTLYTSNITPDLHQGIGGWSLEEFDRALREGIGRDGEHLYPAMPYASYARITDDDVRALYAYFLFGVKPVHQAPPENEIRWFLKPRWPLMIWNGLFLHQKPFEPDPEQSAAWNRGAYLVQGLAHCGECHTPRGVAFQEKAYDETDGGYLAGGPILDGWEAYNITPDPVSGIGQWTADELRRYLKTGHVNGLAQAGGPMAEVIENSLSKMTDADIDAMVTYIRSVPPVGGKAKTPRHGLGVPADGVITLRGNQFHEDIGAGGEDKADGARLYLGLCASCHGVDGMGSRDGYYPSLVHNSTIGALNDNNLRRAIYDGIRRTVDGHEKMMPGFGGQISTVEMKALVKYIREQFGADPAQ
ncbi:cytochrome c [Microbulbifer celer]|uniref:C-type cytochrome n=1 Tax=Microbulbifer celer TaxID=435905 RepID=A0ABW3U8Q0_9GAMM|nr:cytochrome c [Microbulbifer celer]UFN57049.1 cytochrome c [Microbulbifer celer]